MEISKNIPKKFIRSKIFNPFHGGIVLGAVYSLDDINVYETAILIYIGSRHDFHEDTQVLARVGRKEICKKTKISMPTFCRSIKSLIEKNYLYVSNNYDDNGLQVENTYYISDYLFHKSAELKGVNLREYHTETPGVSHREIYNTSVAILPDEPSILTERSEEEEKETIKNARDGQGPSLRQEDARDLENSFVPAKEEKTKPVVTPAHNKMVLLFTPRPELKSFVHRNTILALTDELIGKHGKMAVKAINRLYDDLMAEDLCGKFEWSIKRTMSFFNEALEKLKSDGVHKI